MFSLLFVIFFLLNLFLNSIPIGVEYDEAGEDGDEGESWVEGLDEMKIEAAGQEVKVGKGEDEKGHEEEGGEEFENDLSGGALLGQVPEAEEEGQEAEGQAGVEDDGVTYGIEIEAEDG